MSNNTVVKVEFFSNGDLHAFYADGTEELFDANPATRWLQKASLSSRDEGLEEAAQIVEDHYWDSLAHGGIGKTHGAAIAKAIRSLISRPLAQREEGDAWMETDGFGSFWTCCKGLPRGECQMQVVRPGKVQCNLCDQALTTPGSQP